MTTYMTYVEAVVEILDQHDHGATVHLIQMMPDGYEMLGSALSDEGWMLTMDGLYVTLAVGQRLCREGYVTIHEPF